MKAEFSIAYKSVYTGVSKQLNMQAMLSKWGPYEYYWNHSAIHHNIQFIVVHFMRYVLVFF